MGEKLVVAAQKTSLTILPENRVRKKVDDILEQNLLPAELLFGRPLVCDVVHGGDRAQLLSLGIEDFTELAPECFNHKTHEMGVRHAATSG
jgi:hypothetical protein